MEDSWRYIKSKGKLEFKKRTDVDRRMRYGKVLSDVTARTLYTILTSDRSRVIDMIIFNGVVEGVNPATGTIIRPTLISVRASQEEFFRDRDFRHPKFNSVAFLKDLRAHVSRSPTELEPVDPVLRFEPDRARVIDEEEILSTLNDDKNIMDVSWRAFETLIRDLFNRMGFDTYQTKPNRDGGVDCFAFIQKPVIGIKVVIQAKRYSHKVPVEAVRDLAGTIDNERAGKGMLVTTSDFTRDGRRFAEDNKRIELINGSGLLALIELHTGYSMRIEFKSTS